MASIKNKPTGTYRLPAKRRTFKEIARLRHDQVKDELVAVGIKPFELVVFVEYSGDGPDPRPPLEPHQRYDRTAHDLAVYKNDPFLSSTPAKVFNVDANDRHALHSFELLRYVESLSIGTITKALRTLKTEHGRTPLRTWKEAEYRNEMISRLSNQDQADVVAVAQRAAQTEHTAKRTRKRKGVNQ